jgi:isopenicillin N synthase-like dioxygenase
MSIPLISLADASSPAALAQAISAACRTHGFLYLTEHGISQADVDGAFASSQAFFEEESPAEKERVRAKETNVGVRRSSLVGLSSGRAALCLT